MKHTFEIEIRETEGREPMLHGIVIQEGRAASQRVELFAPGSIQWPAEGIDVLTEHRGAPESKAIPVRSSLGEISIQARATDKLREAVAAGKRFMSIEFNSLVEKRTQGGIREISSAFLKAAALVSSPEYTQTAAEVRDKHQREWPWL